MDTGTLLGAPASAMVPVGISLGEQPATTVAAAVDAVGGLAWLRGFQDEVAVATADVDALGTGRLAARTVAAIVVERDKRARVIAPDRLGLGALPLIGDRDRWRDIDVSGLGTRVDRIPVRRELADAAALVGAGAIGRADDDGPLAIGIWLRHVQPKLAIAARLGGDRAPLAADLAAAFRPRLLVLLGQWGSHLVAVATADQVAAELVGLAIRNGANDDPTSRPNPWEDPLLQRAAELGLGVEHPSAIDLRPVWAGPVGSPAADAILTVGDLVADAIGIL